jgi:protein-S-isoprenylcysteine O-methyltransferase Ste14
MHVLDVVIASIWIAFWVLWIAASAHTKANRSRSTSSIGIRLAILVVVLLLLRSRVLRGHATATQDPWLGTIGFVMFLTGLSLAIWARVHLGRNWGSPMSQKVDPELVTSGPYRRVRHPIYSGIILAMVGTTVTVGLYWLVAVVLLGAYFVYSATVEEHTMQRLFPETYPAYKRSTKMLVPFVF